MYESAMRIISAYMKVIIPNTRSGLLTLSFTSLKRPLIIVSEKEIRKKIIAVTIPTLITSETGLMRLVLKRSMK